MGNLVSFPLLCLLNKACYDICCDIAFGSGVRRIGRFNGDDCMFAGDRRFFDLWREVTSSYGLVVNEEKTGVSKDWLELNSQPFSVRKGRLVAKPVLSFLRPFRKEPGDLLSEVLEGIKSFKAPTRAWVLNVAMRHEISLREISVSNIPASTLRFLLGKSWFRRALQLGPARVTTSGVSRSVPVTVANPPRAGLYRWVEEKAALLQRECVDRWIGVKVRPLRQEIDRRRYLADYKNEPTRRLPFILRHAPRKWQFVWPTELLELVRVACPEALLRDEDCYSEWIDDHHFLTVRRGLVRVRPAPWVKRLRKCFGPAFDLGKCLVALGRL